MRKNFALALVLGAGMGLWGCAHAPSGNEADPRYLLDQACSPGSEVKSVKGSAWISAKSREASGRFPADVLMKNPKELNLEVTNLLGGTEARIQINNSTYLVTVPGKKQQTESGSGSWGGIPLHWATDLFAGKIPCPSSKENLTTNIDSVGALSVTTPEAETFVYKFRNYAGRPWPESLHWQSKKLAALTVDFKFDDPEDHTRSPKKWEAVSSLGEVKVRWKDRTVNGD